MTESVEMKNYLIQLTKELHKPQRKNFQRQKVLSLGKNDIWATDLVDMSQFEDINDGYKWLLNVVDVFTRRAWGFALKNKDAISIESKFEQLIKDFGPVNKIWCDEGKEFVNSKMNKLLKENKIVMYHTYAPFHVSIVERFNRTLKEEMWRRFTRYRTLRWIDMIDDLFEWYNNKNHSSIKTTPIQKWKDPEEENQEIKTYKSYLASKKRKTLFKVGDNVRISASKGVFKKGYTQNWSQEIFQVKRISYPNDKEEPVLYYLSDRNNEEIKGGFYEQELQKTELNGIFLIEEVLKERKKGKKKEYYVKWLGYDDSFNSWIGEDQVFNVNS